MHSIWSHTCVFGERDSLYKDIKVDVVIIGAGITGILNGYFLSKSGKNVVIIDSGKICGGNTRNTTAKITAQHGLIYHKLIKEFGLEFAKKYAQINIKAIDMYKEIIEKENIKCDFLLKPSYLFSLDGVTELDYEFEAYKKLGLDSELLGELINLPFNVTSALKLNNQAQFNPLIFLKHISNDLKIYENTKVKEIRENEVITNSGIIEADYIVVCTHFPIYDKFSMLSLKMHQERSYCVALDNVPNIKGMYTDINSDGLSFRNYKNLLLLSFGGKRINLDDKGDYFKRLHKISQALYPNSTIKYQWSAQDCITVDGVPYIGQFSKDKSNIYMATGFNTWGMTSSMVSAMIINDDINGIDNKFKDIFSPKRLDLSLSIKSMINNGISLSKSILSQVLDTSYDSIDTIKKNEGKIIINNNNKYGVYRDIAGKYHFVSVICPHLGCELKWNKDDLSWDCPCHGSRFDIDGNLIDSPSNNNIKI